MDKNKAGKKFYDAPIYQPEELKNIWNDFDYLLIAHYSRFEEILSMALSLGIERDRIIMPYEV
ncbi:MAG: hypothetical protein K6A38_05330 [Lachnospiraceae bacterium]|nr:hypothetical protein [Lachnospiraceae bacterium]